MTQFEADLDRTIIERVDARLGMLLGGRYRVDYKIAAGGFGAVYHAYDVVARRDVAVKVLHAALATDATVVARFRREVAALAQLRDPHTVVAYDAGEAPDGSMFLVMELLAGESLYERYKTSGPLPWASVVAIARGVCCSLAEAHALGIVHRDLKPANIHVEPRPGQRDYAKVLDFGIAKLRDGAIEDNDITHVGQMVGTFDYMPPEQMAGTCMPQSDIFTLGVVMYEMISGTRPFGVVQGPASQLAAVLGTTPQLLSNVPPPLARIVARCLDREPNARYANANELSAALAELGEKPEHEAPTVPARYHHAVNLEGPTLVERPREREQPRATIAGHAPPPAMQMVAMGTRDSDQRLAAGTVDPFPSPFPYPEPQAPERAITRWPIIMFVLFAIAVGIAIGIGFAH
jgi:serine/threonine protein kinase